MPTAFGREPRGETRQGGACNSCECCTALGSHVRALWSAGASHQLTLIIFQEEGGCAARLQSVKNDLGAGCHSTREDGIPGCSDRAVAPASFVSRISLSPMMGSHRTSGARSCSRIHVINLDRVTLACIRAAVAASREAAGLEARWMASATSAHAARGALYGYVGSVSLMLQRCTVDTRRYRQGQDAPAALPGPHWLKGSQLLRWVPRHSASRMTLAQGGDA